MKKLIKGIHHVSLKCCGEAEYEKTIDFYHRVLGMDIVCAWGEGQGAGAMLNSGSGLIEIFANGEERLEQGAIRHFAFATDNVEACVEAVKKEGYEVFIEPKEVILDPTAAFPIKIAFCYGPVGEQIEFFHEQ